MKDKIKTSFSKSANKYEYNSEIQALIADKLLLFLNKKRKYKNILEIGSGTGLYTKKLLKKYPESNFYLVDFSKDMIEYTKKKFKNYKNLYYLVKDAEQISLSDFQNIKFDLITSNSTFQWFSNLKNSLFNLISLLNKNGNIIFSYFSNKTFQELLHILKEYFNDDKIIIPSSNFLDFQDLKKILTDIKLRFIIKEYIIKKEYKSLLQLLNKIRNTGEYGPGLNKKIIFTPSIIKKMEKIYLEKYKKINVTYHFFIVKIYNDK